MKRKTAIAMIMPTALMLAAAACRADEVFDVSLDTSPISGTTEEQLVFELIDGDGVADNSVSLTNFNLGGGTPAAPADYLGTSGVSGDLSSGVTMNDSGGVALFSQLVNFGSSLTFLLTTTNVFSAGGPAPDALSMSVYTSGFSACYSDDNSCALLRLDLTGQPLTPSSFTLNGATAQGLPAPVVTTANVPEPASLLLVVSALFALGIARKRSGR
jgi:hypothetical protein